MCGNLLWLLALWQLGYRISHIYECSQWYRIFNNHKQLLTDIMISKSNLQEKLVALYLRLNGYMTTGLILHSPNDKAVEGEIDIIGVRFLNHKQPDRVIECAKELEIPNDVRIDIIIGEVKGGKNPLQFNDSVRIYLERVKKLFQWIGISEDKDLDNLVISFMNEIQVKEIQKPSPFPIIRHSDVSIRPILFAPDKTLQKHNQLRFINGKELITFCWNCFRPENRRETCETDYQAMNNWGEQFERLVGYFKNLNIQSPGVIKDIYDHFKVE